MSNSRLESLLLRAGSNELSYGFIEKRLLQCVSVAEPKVAENESTAELITLLQFALQRAGNGWVVIVSKRVSQQIVLSLLRQVSILTPEVDDVLRSLAELLECFPVIASCNFSHTMVELSRLMKANAVPSISLLLILRAVGASGQWSISDMNFILSKVLAALSVARSGQEASACMSLIPELIEYIKRDVQIVNTVIGLSRAAFRGFQDNGKVRHYYKQILSLLPMRSDSHDIGQSNSSPASAETEIPCTRISPKRIVPIEVSLTSQRLESIDNHALAHVVSEFSPKSSCPSLEL